MNKPIIYFIFLLISFTFFILIFNYYISKKNKDNMSLNRTNLSKTVEQQLSKIDILESDTDNIIEFNNGYNFENKKNTNRKFWNLLKKNK
jgi:hypothetical protein